MANISSADGKIILMGDWTQEALDAFKPVLHAWAFYTNIGGDGIRWCGDLDLQHLTADFSGYGRYAFSHTLEWLDEGTRGWIAGHPADTSHPLTGKQYDAFLKILHDKDLHIKIEFADVDEECLEKSYHIGKLTSDGKSLKYTKISAGGHISYEPFYEDREDWDEEDWDEDAFDVNSIKDEVFYDCEEPVSVVIPDNITKIGSLVFSGCKNLTGVTVPPKTEVIRYDAFANCKNLKSVYILAEEADIWDGVFSNCSGLVIHAPAGSYAEKYVKESGISFKAI